MRPKMRRAIRDYKYEVNENRMNDECIQYVIQLQKDWERHRVKLGVEILRKEVWRLSLLTLATRSNSFDRYLTGIESEMTLRRMGEMQAVYLTRHL